MSSSARKVTCGKKATKTEAVVGCLFGFLVTFFLAAYHLNWWSRLTD